MNTDNAIEDHKRPQQTTTLQCPDCSSREFSWVEQVRVSGTIKSDDNGPDLVSDEIVDTKDEAFDGQVVKCNECQSLHGLQNLKSPQTEFSCRLDWSREHGHEIIVESPCPECGNSAIFNGKVQEYGQYVGVKTTDAGEEVCPADDMMDAEIVELRCGKCRAELISSGSASRNTEQNTQEQNATHPTDSCSEP